MEIRPATATDWPNIYTFYAPIMAAGETYAFPENQTLDEAQPWWMEKPPGQTVVATDETNLLGTAKMGPNRPGRGNHIATASFLVHPEHQNKGVGRALGEFVVEWATTQGYAGIQFNAVVETNTAAVKLWKSLGFGIVGTVPGAFRHPKHGDVGLHVMYKPLTN